MLQFSWFRLSGRVVLDRSNSGTVGSKPALLCVVVSYVFRVLEMGRSPVQGIFPKCLRGFILSEVNSEPVQARGPNPLKVNSSNKYEKKLWVVTVSGLCVSDPIQPCVPDVVVVCYKYGPSVTARSSGKLPLRHMPVVRISLMIS